MADTAFAELYHASYARLSDQISCYLGDAAEAEDVVQEAYLRTWQRWDRIARYDDPFAYLRRIAWNLATSRWRRLATAARHLGRQRPPAQTAELKPDHVAIVAALRLLPEQQRRAIVLHYIADLPVDDVAQELGVPRGTVLSWLHRGRGRMADLLSEAESPQRHVPPVSTVHTRSRRRRRIKALAIALGLIGSAAAMFALFPGDVLDPPPPVDTITDVNWRNTVVTLPTGGGPCPAGKKRVRPEGANAGLIEGPRDGVTDPLYLDPARVTFGDLTGDGQPEAFLPVWCSPAADFLMKDEIGYGARLLVVQMRPDHTLHGLAYVGPPGAAFLSYAAVDGNLVTQVQYESATGWSVYAPAHRRTYRWDGATFRQTAGRTTPLILVPSKTGQGSEVSLAEIPGLCPPRTIRFDAQSTQLVYASWVDLDNDGNTEGVVQIGCAGSDSLYLLGQGESSFMTLGIPFANDGTEQIEPDGWKLEGTQLTVNLRHKTNGTHRTLTLHWDGSKFS
jgi:RNA polymerase sigma-70 factor (ECF subfamily)